VSHFRKRINDGTFSILAGPPKKREEFQKIAKNSGKLLSDSLLEHTSQLRDLVGLRESQKSMLKSKIYLGSFNEKTISLYSDVEKLIHQLEIARSKRSIH
jgi:hypothetical protein